MESTIVSRRFWLLKAALLNIKSTSKGERLHLYMRAYNLNPSSTFIIGDMPVETDIARELGLISVAITGGFVSETRLRAAQPDYLIEDHHKLLPILQERGVFQNS